MSAITNKVATIFGVIDESANGILEAAEVKGRQAQVLDSLVNLTADQFEGVLEARRIPNAFVVQTADAIEAQQEAATQVSAQKVGAFFVALGAVLLNLALLPLSLLAFVVLWPMLGARFAAGAAFAGFLIASQKMKNELGDDPQQGEIRRLKETFLARPELSA